MHDEQLSDSQYSHKIKIKNENVSESSFNSNDTSSHPPKKARKSLITSWGENIEKKPVPYETETPSKFLTSADSIAFSSPSIIKDALGETDILLDATEAKKENNPQSLHHQQEQRPKFSQNLDPKWVRLACGQTKDQQFMIQQAHACLKNLSLMPRSLNFEKQK